LNLGDSTKFEEALGGVLVCAWLRWRVYAGQSMRGAKPCNINRILSARNPLNVGDVVFDELSDLVKADSNVFGSLVVFRVLRQRNRSGVVGVDGDRALGEP